MNLPFLTDADAIPIHVLRTGEWRHWAERHSDTLRRLASAYDFQAQNGFRKVGAWRGKLGADVSLEQGIRSAQKVGLCMLATIKAAVGELSRVKRFVRILGMVQATPDFKDHPKVMNGFSDLMVVAFGDDVWSKRRSIASHGTEYAMEGEKIYER